MFFRKKNDKKLEEEECKSNYDVLDLSLYIIEQFNKNKKMINNQILGRLLFIIQCKFVNKTKELCFKDEFVCWPYGPVVDKVYERFLANGILPLTTPAVEKSKLTTVKFKSDTHKEIIDSIIKDFLDTTMMEISNITRKSKLFSQNHNEKVKKSISNRELYHYCIKNEFVYDK